MNTCLTPVAATLDEGDIITGLGEHVFSEALSVLSVDVRGAIVQVSLGNPARSTTPMTTLCVPATADAHLLPPF